MDQVVHVGCRCIGVQGDHQLCRGIGAGVVGAVECAADGPDGGATVFDIAASQCDQAIGNDTQPVFRRNSAHDAKRQGAGIKIG